MMDRQSCHLVLRLVARHDHRDLAHTRFITEVMVNVRNVVDHEHRNLVTILGSLNEGVSNSQINKYPAEISLPTEMAAGVSLRTMAST